MRKILCGATALITTSIIASNPAAGQTGSTNSAPPADKMAVSTGGVDMRTGRYSYEVSDLTIGAGAPGDLSLSRTMVTPIPGHLSPFANFAHQWDITLTEKRVGIFSGNFEYGGGSDYEMSIHYGGRSETFRGLESNNYFDQISFNPYTKLNYSGNRDSSGVIYTYQATDGTIVTFRPLGGGDCSTIVRCAYPSQIIEPDGIKYTFQYDGSFPARLRSVVSSRGYALLFEHSTFVSKACVLNLAYVALPSNNICPSNAQATSSYSYTTFESIPKLATVTDPAGRVASFTYNRVSGTFRMGFVRPGNSAPWLVNEVTQWVNEDSAADERVDRQTFADGNSFTYTYTSTPEVDNRASGIAGGSYTDGQGHTTTVTFGFPVRPGTQSSSTPISYGKIDYQTTSGPISITDPLGRTTTSDYCDPNAMANLPSYEHNRCLVTMLQSTTDAEGIKTEFTYDSWITRNITVTRHKAKPGSPPSVVDIVTTATFDCTYAPLCAKPTSIADARGNTTNYTYDPAHGGVLTEALPAAPNGIRPVKRYAYVQRYAWISNGAGGYVQGSSAAWLLAEERTCKTTATVSNACAGGSSDEVITTYDYGPNSGPNNLLLRGVVVDSGGLALRTCYGYDQLGNKISETKPRAGLTSCP